MDAFIKKGFYTIGALKTNRILYPYGMKQKLSEFALSLRKTDALDRYVERWPVEAFFGQSKNPLALDRYQIRPSKGIRRYWLLMSLSHFIACTGSGKTLPFEEGYRFFYNRIREERIHYIYLIVL